MTIATAAYTKPAILLHWIVAGLVLAGFAIGSVAVDLEISPAKLKLYSWHKWVGVTVFLLMMIRLAWRWTHPAPGSPVSLAAWERQWAGVTHALLYLLLFAVPLSGWLMSSASGFPVAYLGVIPLPDLVGKDKDLSDLLKIVHDWLNNSLLILILLHVAAAFKHHFYDRDAVLSRMLPWRSPRRARRGSE